MSAPLRCLLVMLALSGCGNGGAAPLPIDFVVAGSLVHRGDGASLLWVLQPADYVHCETHARAIRLVQRRNGHQVPLTIVAVGGREEWLAEFLRRERLRGEVRSFTPQSFRSEFGRNPSSALYVLHNARVVSILPLNGLTGTTSEELALASVVREVLQEVAAASITR